MRLIQIPLHSGDCYRMMEIANRMSREQFSNKGENHLHIGLNVEPCPLDCLFCSLTHKAGIFTEKIDFSDEQIIAWRKMPKNMEVMALFDDNRDLSLF